MEFDIRLVRPVVETEAESLVRAILAVDPAAVVAVASDGRSLRAATVLGGRELELLLAAEGCHAAAGQVVALPSVCCGGCSG